MKLIFPFIFLVISIASSANDTRKCPPLKKMEVLPSRGWDSLRNLDMAQVLEMKYDNCVTSEDGQYLIPDNIHLTAIKASELKLTSELIEHWSNYSSVTAQSFKVNAGWNLYGAASIQGSFDVAYQNAKSHQVEDFSMTTRVQLRIRQYVVQSTVYPKIHPVLENVLMQVLTEIKNKNDEKATYLSEMIIREYGTHYITQADAGALILEEDYVNRKFVIDNWAQKSQVGISAGASFLNKLHFGAAYTQSVDQNFYREYIKQLTSNDVRTFGGQVIQPNLTIEQWVKSVPNNLVMIDRSGNPLSYLITPENFPQETSINLNALRMKIDTAITDYYKYNTHLGCTNVNSPNFDYTANVDDGSCKSQQNNYTFGGVFVECTNIQMDAGYICSTLEQKNPMTGELSCPTNYSAILLTTGIKTQERPTPKCHDVCHGILWWKTCRQDCHDVYLKSSASYKTYWCVDYDTPVSNNTGFMFGGLYTSWTNNPLTQTKGCPLAYLPFNLGPDLKVCMSNDYELGFRSAIRFGGFFSCGTGNPLVGENSVTASNGNKFIKGCPKGYSQHLAVIDYGCEVNYCVEANAFGSKGKVEIVLPPFRDRSALFTSTSVLRAMTPSQEVSSLSSNEVAVIAVVVILIVIIIASLVLIVRIRRKRSRLLLINEEQAPLIDEERPRVQTENA